MSNSELSPVSSFASCSCGAALVAGMPLCAVPVHSGRWGAGGGDRVQETERRGLAPSRRHEPLLERDQAQVPQHPVRGNSWSCLLCWFRGRTLSEPKCRKNQLLLEFLVYDFVRGGRSFFPNSPSFLRSSHLSRSSETFCTGTGQDKFTERRNNILSQWPHLEMNPSL